MGMMIQKKITRKPTDGVEEDQPVQIDSIAQAGTLSTLQVKELLRVISGDENLQQEFRQALGAAGAVGGSRPARKRRAAKKAGDEHARKFSFMMGDATHGPDFLPVPPDPVVLKAKELEKVSPGRGQDLLDRYYERWERGNLVGETGLSPDDVAEIEGMMTDAAEGLLV